MHLRVHFCRRVCCWVCTVLPVLVAGYVQRRYPCMDSVVSENCVVLVPICSLLSGDGLDISFQGS